MNSKEFVVEFCKELQNCAGMKEVDLGVLLAVERVARRAFGEDEQ